MSSLKIHLISSFRFALCWALTSLLWTVPARADSVSMSATASQTPATADNSASGSNGTTVSSQVDVSTAWMILTSFGLTRPQTSHVGDAYAKQEKESNVYALTLDASWIPDAGHTTTVVDEDGETSQEDVDPHWTLDVGALWSPQSTTLTSTTLVLPVKATKLTPAGSEEAPALLKAQASSIGSNLSLAYDTAGSGPWQWELTLAARPNWVTTQQTLQQYEDRQGNTHTRAELLASCQGVGASADKALKKTCKTVTALLKAEADSLLVVPVTLDWTQTWREKTDFSIFGAYFLYSSDPNAAGYFNLAAAGRKIGGASFGTGVAIAPFLWNSGTSISHVWGDLRLTASAGYARYVDDGGSYRSFALKIGYKISKNWKLSGAVATQNDIDDTGVASRSYAGTAGLRYTF